MDRSKGVIIESNKPHVRGDFFFFFSFNRKIYILIIVVASILLLGLRLLKQLIGVSLIYEET